MKLTDLVELAKAGYKPSEIRELMGLPIDEDKEINLPEDKENLQEVEDNLQEDEDKPHDSNNEEIESLNKKIEEQQKLIEALQAQNRNINVQPDGSKEIEALSSAIRGFM